MIIYDRIQKAYLSRKYRDEIISQVSAMRDHGMSIVAISEKLNLSEPTVRNIIKRIL